ncbi:TPA: YitT family protein [Clostridium perfringens]|uniref:YitT family protein n=1 Tax=Clostridium perfringens TaxID=1502 RepID=UPI001A2AEE22|nr:YitT family protein [Clostridium perfringens]
MKISMKTLKEYGIITLGVILLAISLEYFYYPNDIAAGGVSGLALVVNKITGISQGMFMNVANVILFALAFWLIGGSFGGRSIYAAFGLSITISLIESFLPTFAVTENMLLATIFGSVVGAFGIALVFSQNSSTGGTAIVAKILNKYLHIEIGKSLLCADCVVVVCALLVFGVDKALFGLIGVFIMGILIDKIIEGFNSCKQLLIISEKSEEISQVIMKEIERGCTKIEGTGGYSKEPVTILYVVVNRRQFISLKKKIKEIDSRAFITVNDSKEVFGEGFLDLVEM